MRLAVGAKRVAAVLVLVVALASCGSRRSHDDVVAAGTGVDQVTSAPGAGTTAAVGAGAAGTSTTLAAPVAGGDGTTTAIGGTTADTEVPVDGATAVDAAGPACPNGPLAPVNIGHIGGYAGLVGATLNGGLETAQIWARSVNSRGGLACHPVNLIAVNDQNDPNTNASLVRQLVEQKGVIAFVGNLTPLSLGGGISYLEQHHVPLVGGDLVHPAWNGSPIAFPQGIATDLGAPASMIEGVRSAQARGLPNPTTVAMFTCEVEACTSARDAVQARNGNGYTLAYAPNISLVQTSFTNECQQAQAKNVGVVFVGGSGATLEAAANSCHDQGFNPQWVSYSLAIQDSLAGNPNLELAVGASPTFPWMLRDGIASEYGAALARYAPNLTTSGAASQVWTAGKLLEDASRNLPANPTSADIIAGLHALAADNLAGLTTALGYGGDGAHPQAGCYFVVQVSGQRWTAPHGSDCIPVQ